MSKRQVVYAKTHSNIFVPGIGEMTQTLPPANKTVELKMFLTSEGLVLDAARNGVKVEILIPHTNVALMVLAPETKSE